MKYGRDVPMPEVRIERLVSDPHRPARELEERPIIAREHFVVVESNRDGIGLSAKIAISKRQSRRRCSTQRSS